MIANGLQIEEVFLMAPGLPMSRMDRTRSTVSLWLKHTNPERVIHAALVGILLWISYCFSLHHFRMLDQQAFSAMAAAATQWHWSLLLGGCGLVGALGLIPHRPGLRILTLMVLGFAHIVFALFLYWGMHGATTGIGPYGAAAILGFYLVLREATR